MNPAPPILAVDDEPKILDTIAAYLERAGYRVARAANGLDAQRVLNREPVALALLDLMLPDLPGEDLCARIRAGFYDHSPPDTPVIMITAKTDEASVLRGFNRGADDYVTKPFSPRELVARVQAVLRRDRRGFDGAVDAAGAVNAAPSGDAAAPAPLTLGDLVIDPANRRVTRRGVFSTPTLTLTRNEAAILRVLASRPGRVWSRDELLSALGADGGFDATDRAIDSHVKNLRRKLGDNPRSPRYIETVYGLGYRCPMGTTGTAGPVTPRG